MIKTGKFKVIISFWIFSALDKSARILKKNSVSYFYVYVYQPLSY